MSNIHRTLADGIVTLTFDRPGSSANIFDAATLRELDDQIAAIEKDPAAKGLVLISAKEAVFIAGADLKAISGLSRPELEEFLALGQRVFTRIEKLRIPTVAAIHGACVGGGYEVTLACRYRVASDHRTTRIGLPETQLGILPAWGGSTRLPRVIGLAASLGIILDGKTPSAKRAKQLGMVDEIVPREHLRDAALAALARGDKPRRAPLLKNFTKGFLLRGFVRHKLLAKTRGHYPAPAAALDVVCAATRHSLEASLARERSEVAKLAGGETSKNLLRLFFLTEKAKKGDGEPNAIVNQVAVIGAGVMGAGITEWCAAQRLPVLLRDIDPDRVAAGLARVAKLVADNKEFDRHDAGEILDRVTPAATGVPLARADFVIEAAVERMELKKKIFAGLEDEAGPETILATNTSALSITALAAGLKDPGRVIGMHFFNPVHRMKLVEIVVGAQTRPEVVARTLGFVRRIGKLPVAVKDSPGFVVNRILMPYLLEAARFYTHGADARDIDEAMLDFGMPMGPLRLIDEVGLDVSEDVAVTLAAGLGPRVAAPPVLGEMLRAGLTGRKAGKGFYLYSGKGEPAKNPEAKAFRKDTKAARLSRSAMADCMVALMVNEAARCLEEGVAASAGDIDFAMVMGTGFAPFRGGPLRYADSIGLTRYVCMMRSLAEEHGRHYEPCALLDRLANDDRKFYAD